MASLKLTTTATTPDATPFLPGRNATVVVYGAGVVQGMKADGSGYETLVTGTANDITVADITIPANLKTDTGVAYLIGGA